METEEEIREFLSLPYDQQDYLSPGPKHERQSKASIDFFLRLCEDHKQGQQTPGFADLIKRE